MDDNDGIDRNSSTMARATQSVTFVSLLEAYGAHVRADGDLYSLEEETFRFSNEQDWPNRVYVIHGKLCAQDDQTKRYKGVLAPVDSDQEITISSKRTKPGIEMYKTQDKVSGMIATRHGMS
jgi:hypothetical protein